MKMSHQRAANQITEALDQLSNECTACIGRITAAWVYLETELDNTIQCLLTMPETDGLHDDCLLLPFKSRLALVRAAGKLFYTQMVFDLFEQVLGKVANAYGQRNPIVHGRFVATEQDGSYSVENHRQVRKDGAFKVIERTYSLKQLAAISSTVVDAAGALVDFNREHLPGRPASWLDYTLATASKRQPAKSTDG